MFRSFKWISLKSSKSIILNSHWCSCYTFLAFPFSVAQNMVNRIFRLIKSPKKTIFQLRKSLSSTRTILPKVLRRRIRSKSWGLGRWWMVILWRFWGLFNGMLVFFVGDVTIFYGMLVGFFLMGFCDVSWDVVGIYGVVCEFIWILGYFWWFYWIFVWHVWWFYELCDVLCDFTAGFWWDVYGFYVI